MWKVGKTFIRLGKDERAASAVEYGLILALIVLAIMAALQQVASTTINMWNNVSTQVSSTSS
jgi:pilus assembly protein Flp/PilA